MNYDSNEKFNAHEWVLGLLISSTKKLLVYTIYKNSVTIDPYLDKLKRLLKNKTKYYHYFLFALYKKF